MNNRSNLFSIVIGYNDLKNNRELPTSNIEMYCHVNSDIIQYYFLIKHDKDNNEYIHYHLILCFYQNHKFGKMSVIKDLASYLNCSSSNIQCQLINDLSSCVRYLTHLDENENKYKYDSSEVLTNDIDKYTELVNSCGYNEVDLSLLIALVKGDYSITEIYQYIGLKNAIRYRNIINDLIKDLRGLN